MNLEKSLAVNETICELNCTVIDGHMPYVYEVDSILNKLYINGSISETNFPIFTEDSWQIRTWLTEESSRKFSFFISAKYDFYKRIWNSGGLKIKKKYWAERNMDEQVYPILDDRLLLVQNVRQWKGTDHWGAVNCNNDFLSSFKV